MDPGLLVLSILFVSLCWSLAIQSQCRTHPFYASEDRCETDVVFQVKTREHWNYIFKNAENLEIIEELRLKDTVKTSAEMRAALETICRAFKTQKFPSGHLAEFVNHVRAWTLLAESQNDTCLQIEDTVTQSEDFAESLKGLTSDLRKMDKPHLILLGPSGSTQAYLMNRAMARQLLNELEKSHAKDFVNVANFLSLQCKGPGCEQVKIPLATRKDSVVERLHNLIQISVPNASPTASRNPSRK